MNATLFHLDDLIIHIFRKPIKHMYIRIKPPQGEIQVSIPLKASLKILQQQLELKKNWIHAQRARVLLKPLSLSPILENGAKVFFLGEALTMVIHRNSHAAYKFKVQDTSLLCFLPITANSDTLPPLLNNWYREQLHLLVPALIYKWERIIGVSGVSYSIRLMKSRWGSCHPSKKHIVLNLNLAKKSMHCIEYVLVHEFVHLLEASHNKRFYQLMFQYMPDWQTHQTTLEPEAKRKFRT
jgi:predicted metal-dependent hydrolase